MIITDLVSLVARQQVQNKLHHAYLIECADETQMELLNQALTLNLLCTETKQGKACQQCVACKSQLAGANPDVLLISKGDNSQLPIDSVRSAINYMALPANVSSHKILTLHWAEEMSANAANAMLKLLEEPPSGRILLLFTQHSDALLPTLKSRCFKVGLTPSLINENEAVDDQKYQAFVMQFEKWLEHELSMGVMMESMTDLSLGEVNAYLRQLLQSVFRQALLNQNNEIIKKYGVKDMRQAWNLYDCYVSLAKIDQSSLSEALHKKSMLLLWVNQK